MQTNFDVELRGLLIGRGVRQGVDDVLVPDLRASRRQEVGRGLTITPLRTLLDTGDQTFTPLTHWVLALAGLCALVLVVELQNHVGATRVRAEICPSADVNLKVPVNRHV